MVSISIDHLTNNGTYSNKNCTISPLNKIHLSTLLQIYTKLLIINEYQAGKSFNKRLSSSVKQVAKTIYTDHNFLNHNYIEMVVVPFLVVYGFFNIR